MNLPQYKCHLFICTHSKEKGSSCGPKEGANLRLELKKRLEEKYPDKKSLFRINASGCLSQCEKGITAVSYPRGQWFTGLTHSESDLCKLEKFVLNEIQS